MQPEPVQSPQRLLNSWKEIAAYLEINVRTAQIWEAERGMPVNRLPGGRARVWAYADAIDAWREGATAAATTAVAPDPPARRRRWWPWGLAAASILAMAGIGVYALVPGPQPAAHRVESNAIVVLDKAGNELWRAGFTHPLALLHYQSPFLRLFETADLDGDGRVEVLLGVVPSDLMRPDHAVVCYSGKGKERWRYTPGRTVSIGGTPFTPPYHVGGIAVLPGGAATRPRIVASNQHVPYFAGQLVLLSHDGKVLREYWHAGHIQRVSVLDVDGDGSPEIWAAGVNNARRCAEVVTLDPDDFGGAGVESRSHYVFDGMPPARERARIFLPPTCLNRKAEPYNVALRTWLQGDFLFIETDELPSGPGPVTVIWQFKRDLTPVSVTMSDRFRTRHKEAEELGQVGHAWHEAALTHIGDAKVEWRK